MLNFSCYFVDVSYVCAAILMPFRYPGTGEYDKFFGEGIYECAGCGTPLYRSTTKFNSGCGWPAFFEGVPGAITRTVCLFSFNYPLVLSFKF